MAESPQEQGANTLSPATWWQSLLPMCWRGMPLLYVLLAFGGIVLGISSLLYVSGIRLPGTYFDSTMILGGAVGGLFIGLLWLAEGSLILLRRRMGLWVLWGALAYTYIPVLWLGHGVWREHVSLVAIPVILGVWAWRHRRWLESS